MRSITDLLSKIAQLPKLDLLTRDRSRALLWKFDRHAWAAAMLG